MFRANVDWDAEIDNVFNLLKEGVTTIEVGAVYGVSKQTISNKIKKYKLKERGLPLGGSAKAKIRNITVEEYKQNVYGIHPNTKRALRKQNTKTFEALCYTKFKNKRNNCLRKGIPFNLIFEEITFPKICPMLGIELDYTEGRLYADNMPVFDRIDSTLGYLRGNVHVISQRANRIKNDSTPEELKKILDYLTKLVYTYIVSK